MNDRPKIVSKKKAAENAEITESIVADKIISTMRSEENAGDIQRITVDMPRYLYDQMKDKMQKKGYSMKTYIVGLVRKDLGDE
jgi:hypothetical protein